MKLDIEALKALHARATQREWRVAANGLHIHNGPKGQYAIVADCIDVNQYPENRVNPQYIAALHNAFPALVDRLERAEATLAAACADTWADLIDAFGRMTLYQRVVFIAEVIAKAATFVYVLILGLNAGACMVLDRSKYLHVEMTWQGCRIEQAQAERGKAHDK